MGVFARPCIECGKLSKNGTRCEQCAREREAIRDAMRPKVKRVYRNKGPRPHYQGDYAKRAREVRKRAVYCHLCGDTARANDPWTADHLIAGDPNSPLLPAHRSCNSRRGDKPLGEQ